MTLYDIPAGSGYNFKVVSNSSWYIDGLLTNISLVIKDRGREIYLGDKYYGLSDYNMEGQVKIKKVIE